jgi:hypothetical protein
LDFCFTFVLVVIARTAIVGGIHGSDLIIDGQFGEERKSGRREVVP